MGSQGAHRCDLRLRALEPAELIEAEVSMTCSKSQSGGLHAHDHQHAAT